MIKGQNRKGFTLIELLVVIAIIIILAAALFLVINPAALLRRTRDTRRMDELNELNKAIAATYANTAAFTLGGTYPQDSCSNGTSADGSDTVAPTGYIDYTPTGALQAFIPSLPRDPRNGDLAFTGTNFCYVFAGDVTNQDWEIYTYMESPEGLAAATNDGGNANTCTTVPSATCRYEVGTDMTNI